VETKHSNGKNRSFIKICGNQALKWKFLKTSKKIIYQNLWKPSIFEKEKDHLSKFVETKASKANFYEWLSINFFLWFRR